VGDGRRGCSDARLRVNYEVHGNSIVHLHMHFLPRYPGDSFEGRPIDPRAVAQPVYAIGEVATFRARLRAALVDAAGGIPSP
jgi:diadenosine tetraphosphate (Ap4A) HIT family hydrolase